MKWTIKWESSMDTNDADYVYDSGEYGDVDDNNPKDMKELAFTQVAIEYCCDNYDYGYLNLDEDEFRELMITNDFLLSIATKEEIEEFCKDIDVRDMMYDIMRRTLCPESRGRRWSGETLLLLKTT